MQFSRGAPIVIRPGGVGEVLDAGLRLARRNYWPLVLLSAWALVPWFVLEAIVALVRGPGQLQAFTTVGRMPAFSGIDAVLGIVSFLIVSLALLAVLFACGTLITEGNAPNDLDVGTLYRDALSRLRAYVLQIIIFAVLAVPLIILFPLGIYLLVRWTPALAALTLERKGPIASLGRSWELTRGSWWHTLGILVVASILVAILEAVLGGIASAVGVALTFAGNVVVGSIVSAIAGLLLGLLVTPFEMAIYAVLYYELRARREGFDLLLRSQQMVNM